MTSPVVTDPLVTFPVQYGALGKIFSIPEECTLLPINIDHCFNKRTTKILSQLKSDMPCSKIPTDDFKTSMPQALFVRAHNSEMHLPSHVQ